MKPALDANWLSAEDDRHSTLHERDRLCIAQAMIDGVCVSLLMWLAILITMP